MYAKHFNEHIFLKNTNHEIKFWDFTPRVHYLKYKIHNEINAKYNVNSSAMAKREHIKSYCFAITKTID